MSTIHIDSIRSIFPLHWSMFISLAVIKNTLKGGSLGERVQSISLLGLCYMVALKEVKVENMLLTGSFAGSHTGSRLASFLI